MVMPAALPYLTLLEGGRKPDRRSAAEEAHVEAVAFCDEVVSGAARIVDALFGLPVPSALAINEAMRLAYRAERAKAELVALGPRDGGTAA